MEPEKRTAVDSARNYLETMRAALSAAYEELFR
jgi:hypothetical protein